MLAKRKIDCVRQRRATEADAEIGRRVRSRRLEQRLSQTELANKIGITFQQVQKYEKGSNRIGAGRLQGIADALAVPVTYFFAKTASTPEYTLLQSSGSIRLAKAYNKITSRAGRQHLVEMAEHLAGGA